MSTLPSEAYAASVPRWWVWGTLALLAGGALDLASTLLGLSVGLVEATAWPAAWHAAAGSAGLVAQKVVLTMLVQAGGFVLPASGGMLLMFGAGGVSAGAGLRNLVVIGAEAGWLWL